MAKKRPRGFQKSMPSNQSRIDSPKKHGPLLGHVREVLMLSLLAFFVFLIYSNTVGGSFVFDDTHNILNNPHIRLIKLTLGDITRAGLESPLSNRPVANISFALNYYFHQYHVAGYHLVNILIHVMTGIFLYLFVRTTLSLPSLRSRYDAQRWIPFFAVFFWLVHPIQTQSVTYIVQRMNSMAAMFYVFSLLLYAKARLAEAKGKKRVLFAGCILTGILSLGSKQIAATLPFFIFLYEWYFFQDLRWTWLKRHALPLMGILILLVIVALMYLGVHPLEKILISYDTRDFTLTQRMLTQFRVVIFYISLLIFPHPSRLNLDHDFPISHSLVDPVTTMLSIGAIVGLIGLAIYMAKKERLLSFCILWFLGNLVIESSVIGLEIIFEHRTYLPSMLLGLMGVTLAYRHIRRKRIWIGVLCAVVMLFSFWTYERNKVWRSEITLWKDSVAKSPLKARPHNNLGVALANQKRFKEAMGHFDEALRIKPDYADVHNNVGAALARAGKVDEAISAYSEALRLKPEDADANSNMGVALISQGKLKEAMRYLSEAVRLNPHFADAHNNMAAALARQGKLKEAISHYLEALRIKPHSAEAHNNLAVALKRQGKLKEAMSHLSEAMRLNPHFAEPHFNLGDVLKRQGRPKEAIGHYSQALRLNPHNPEVHYKLGNALAVQGKFTEAINLYYEALRLNPDYLDAYNNLGNALATQGRLKEATQHFFQALRINPDDAEVHFNLGNALATQGRLKEAMSHYSEALRINPDDAEARGNLERVLRTISKSTGRSNTLPRP